MTSMLVRESRLPVGSSASSSDGFVDQRAGDGHALLLAARELIRVVIDARAEADGFERRRGAAPRVPWPAIGAP